MASTARALPVLPDEILEAIFLRLDAAADLARASAACSYFRRLVSARRFLRRFRSHHSPPALGLLDGDGYEGRSLLDQRFIPVEGAHRAATAARALAEAADFTFSFLPEPCSWRPRDARGGRVVLTRRTESGTAFEDLVVCDPLHRRYVQIPRVPDDLAPSVPRTALHFGTCLDPAGEDDDGKEEPSSFRVLCIFQVGNKITAFVFSSAKQEWRVITYLCSCSRPFGYRRFCVHCCFYWMDDLMECSLVIDTQNMKFSIHYLLPNNDLSQRAIVEAGEGRLRMLEVTFSHGTSDPFCKVWQNNAVGAGEWQHDRMIPLPKHSDGSNYGWSLDSFLGASDGYLTLMGLHRDGGVLFIHSYYYFVLDLKTLLLERLFALHGDFINDALVYATFPPPLAPPTM